MTRKEYDDIKDGLLEAIGRHQPLSSRYLIPKLTGECHVSEFEAGESLRRLVDDGELLITKDLKLELAPEAAPSKR